MTVITQVAKGKKTEHIKSNLNKSWVPLVLPSTTINKNPSLTLMVWDWGLWSEQLYPDDGIVNSPRWQAFWAKIEQNSQTTDLRKGRMVEVLLKNFVLYCKVLYCIVFVLLCFLVLVFSYGGLILKYIFLRSKSSVLSMFCHE